MGRKPFNLLIPFIDQSLVISRLVFQDSRINFLEFFQFFDYIQFIHSAKEFFLKLQF